MKYLYRFLIPVVFAFVSILSTSAQNVDVLSYNIRFASFGEGPHDWSQRRDGICRILKGHDFIGLQEVVPAQIDDIKQHFEGSYGVLFRTRESDPSVGEGSPILYDLSRWELLSSNFYWLSDTPEIPGSNTWGAAFCRIATFGVFREIISGDSILVINTHFDHISQVAREKSIAFILSAIGKRMYNMPVIFMGDLNVTPENPVYQIITSQSNLTDTWSKVNKGSKVSGASFHGWIHETPKERIDYIFVSPMLAPKSSSVIHKKYKGDYPSDHFPLNTVIEFTPLKK